MRRYKIGDVLVEWQEGNFELLLDEYMSEFLVDDDSCCDEIISYKTEFYPLENFASEMLVEKNGLYEMYETSRGKLLIYHWATCRFAFGFFVETIEEECMVCYFNPKMKGEIALAAVRFFSCAALHSKLLQKDAFILHSSYIDWHNQGILFIGPSGVGKSTQASLWKQFAHATIINGDRTLIRKKDSLWHAYGYPCCGSSLICINRTLPLRAIVVLSQGLENKIEKLSVSQKYRALLTGTEMYLWYDKEVERVNQLIGEIVNDVDILKLTCRKDEDAVLVLKEELEGFYE